MPTYVVSHCIAGRSRAARAASRQAADDALERLRRHADVRHDAAPPGAGRRLALIAGDPHDVAAAAARLPRDVIVEPAVSYRPHANASALVVDVSGRGRALAGVQLTLLQQADPADEVLAAAVSNQRGRGVVQISAPASAPTYLLVQPAGGFWSMYLENPRRTVTVRCPPLPRSGPLGWWHDTVGVRACSDADGAGIRIGIVGTGVGAHACLQHVQRTRLSLTRRGARMLPEPPLDVGVPASVDGPALPWHETAVCGLIAARPRAAGDYSGLARGADVVSLRIYQRTAAGQMVSDQRHLAAAIDLLADGQSEARVDLINLSLGAPQASRLVHDAIRHAWHEGVLCTCSAGNMPPGASSGTARPAPVEWPARFAQSVAVAALGRDGKVPAHSISSYWGKVGRRRTGRDGLYVASFSKCASPHWLCGAPGSGVISTVPVSGSNGGAWAAVDGTSYASPIASAVLARLLARNQEYARLPRSGRRGHFARAALASHCRNVGIASLLGHGLAAV